MLRLSVLNTPITLLRPVLPPLHIYLSNDAPKRECLSVLNVDSGQSSGRGWSTVGLGGDTSSRSRFTLTSLALRYTLTCTYVVNQLLSNSLL
jgi:hypothetical protein